MLTRELIMQDESLSSLTDEQVTAIETLSKNDENAVIGNRFGEVYRTFDENIAKASGITRNGDEKTYVYLDRVLGELTSKNEETSKKVNDLTKENQRLTKALADGAADTEAKKQLAQSQKDLAAITNQYNDLKSQYDKLESSHKSEILGLQIDSELNNAKSGIKFKAGLPAGAADVVMASVFKSIKSMKPEFIDNGNGGKVLVFHDKEGAVLRNPEDKLNPFTASSLLRSELKKLGVVDEGVHQEGIGTSPTMRGTSPSAMDLGGARTQVEAMDIIDRTLMQRGMIKGSSSYQKALNEAWIDNNVASLPQR